MSAKTKAVEVSQREYQNVNLGQHQMFRLRIRSILDAVGDMGDVTVYCYPNSHPIQQHLETILQTTRKLSGALDDEVLRVYLTTNEEYIELDSESVPTVIDSFGLADA